MALNGSRESSGPASLASAVAFSSAPQPAREDDGQSRHDKGRKTKVSKRLHRRLGYACVGRSATGMRGGCRSARAGSFSSSSTILGPGRALRRRAPRPGTTRVRHQRSTRGVRLLHLDRMHEAQRRLEVRLDDVQVHLSSRMPHAIPTFQRRTTSSAEVARKVTLSSRIDVAHRRSRACPCSRRSLTRR